MDLEKKWGCIGYALLALIIWGLTQGFKVVCIIIGILIAILIAFIFILKSATPFPKCYLHKEKWTFDS